jgi:hypothetical protein
MIIDFRQEVKHGSHPAGPEPVSHAIVMTDDLTSARGHLAHSWSARLTPDDVEPTVPDRNLALELARVTEAAALAAGRWVGRGDKNGADGAAVSAMRLIRSTAPGSPPTACRT